MRERKRIITGLTGSALIASGCVTPIEVKPIETRPDQINSGVIFASDRTGNWDIFRTDSNGTVNLTLNPASDMNPQLSPNGLSIVFHSDRDGDFEIYSFEIAEPDNVRQLTNNGASDYDPTFSPDGKKIVYKSNQKDGYGDLWIMSADGTSQTNLTPGLSQTEEWKPDFASSSEIVYTSRLDPLDNTTDEIFILNLDTQESTQLTEGDVSAWYPDVNPLTGEIVFTAKEDPSQGDGLYIMNKDGSDIEILSTPGLTGDNNDPSWNQAGNEVVFINNGAGKYDIFTITTAGKLTRIDNSPNSNELSPLYID